MNKKKAHVFLTLWTLAIIATSSAFVVHLALRGRTVSLGYELGRARSEQARLREVKRVLQVEAASYETPERVELVARTLLGMDPAPPERMLSLSPLAPQPDDARSNDKGESTTLATVHPAIPTVANLR